MTYHTEEKLLTTNPTPIFYARTPAGVRVRIVILISSLARAEETTAFIPDTTTLFHIRSVVCRLYAARLQGARSAAHEATRQLLSLLRPPVRYRRNLTPDALNPERLDTQQQTC